MLQELKFENPLLPRKGKGGFFLPCLDVIWGKEKCEPSSEEKKRETSFPFLGAHWRKSAVFLFLNRERKKERYYFLADLGWRLNSRGESSLSRGKDAISFPSLHGKGAYNLLYAKEEGRDSMLF